MKRRDPAAEREHWSHFDLFRRGRRLRRVRAIWRGLVIGVLGLSMVLVVGVIVFGPGAGVARDAWPKVERLP